MDIFATLAEIDAKIDVYLVKSLWGNCSVFPVLGTGDTDRFRIVPNTGKTLQSPQSDLTPWKLTLCRG